MVVADTWIQQAPGTSTLLYPERTETTMPRLPPPAYELSLSKDHGLPWRVMRVELSEALNQPYCARVEAVTESEAPQIESMLGCSATLSQSRGPEHSRDLCGLVSRIDFLGYEGLGLYLRFHIVPALELLRQRVDSRIWQDASVQEIVADVLDGAFADFERSFNLDALSRGRQPRDYCVQYRESDFAFVSRLLEEEGISYEFIHDAEAMREVMTLRDSNEQYAKLVNLDDTNEIPVVVSNPGEIDVESIQVFEWSTQLTSTAVLRRDFDWMTPRQLVSASVDEADARGRTRRVFDHGRRRFIVDDLDERARDLHQARGLAARVVHGRSNVTAMRPGLRFVLASHPHHEFEGEYLITEVVHSGAEAETSSDAGTPTPYTNHFVCVPFAAEFRPERRTPEPREYGAQTAIVTGPRDEEIHTDEHGRIKVQFYWQAEASYDESSSCWIRCSQSWAGVGWGTQFIPRIGMEVVVEFLEGNPDRPLVTGCVYNAEHPPPFALPEHKSQSGWRSDSTPGGGGSNELRFEDAAGNEEIYLHGEKDWTIAIENDKRQQIGRDESLTVGNDRSKTIRGSERFEIAREQVGVIAQNQTLSVAMNQQVVVGLSRTDAVGVALNESVGGAKTVRIGAALSEAVGGAKQTSVSGDLSLDVGGDSSERVAGDLNIEATNATMHTSEDASFSTQKSFLVEATERISLHAEDEVIVEATKQMTFKCGDASIVLKEDGKVLIKGSDIKIKGSGSVSIKGQNMAGN
jgi:type VI secretion system secreted protein VgrG